MHLKAAAVGETKAEPVGLLVVYEDPTFSPVHRSDRAWNINRGSGTDKLRSTLLSLSGDGFLTPMICFPHMTTTAGEETLMTRTKLNPLLDSNSVSSLLPCGRMATSIQRYFQGHTKTATIGKRPNNLHMET